jgi:hypothetical protein
MLLLAVSFPIGNEEEEYDYMAMNSDNKNFATKNIESVTLQVREKTRNSFPKWPKTPKLVRKTISSL